MELALNKIKKEIILLKNFNAYYPIWGGRAAVIKNIVRISFKKDRAEDTIFINPVGRDYIVIKYLEKYN